MAVAACLEFGQDVEPASEGRKQTRRRRGALALSRRGDATITSLVLDVSSFEPFGRRAIADTKEPRPANRTGLESREEATPWDGGVITEG